MTGRGAGHCGGQAVSGWVTRFGRGGGSGFRNMFYLTGLPGWLRFGRAAGRTWGPATGVMAPDELDALQGQAGWLRQQLSAIEKRISQMAGEGSSE